MIDNEVLHAILKLNPLSISKIAENIGQHRVNLQAGLAGKRPLPKNVVEALLEVCGITNGMPDTNQVYIWHVGMSKEPLKLALPYFFPAGAEIGAVWRNDNISLKKIIDPLVQYIRHRNTRVIIIYKGLTNGVSPEEFPTLHWKDTIKNKGRLVTVGEKMGAWIAGNISVKEFDNTLGNQVASWNQVIEAATKKGLAPDNILDYIERIWDNKK